MKTNKLTTLLFSAGLCLGGLNASAQNFEMELDVPDIDYENIEQVHTNCKVSNNGSVSAIYRVKNVAVDYTVDNEINDLIAIEARLTSSQTGGVFETTPVSAPYFKVLDGAQNKKVFDISTSDLTYVLTVFDNGAQPGDERFYDESHGTLSIYGPLGIEAVEVICQSGLHSDLESDD